MNYFFQFRLHSVYILAILQLICIFTCLAVTRYYWNVLLLAHVLRKFLWFGFRTGVSVNTGIPSKVQDLFIFKQRTILYFSSIHPKSKSAYKNKDIYIYVYICLCVCVCVCVCTVYHIHGYTYLLYLLYLP